MKRISCLLLALVLALPFAAPAAQTPSLEGLGAAQLEALRQEADSRLRLMQLADAEGYLDILGGEGYSRDPQAFLGDKIRFGGTVLRAEAVDGGHRYEVSPDSRPERVFLVAYEPAADERRLLAGDRVSVYGVFEGLGTPGGEAPDSLPLVRADLVVLQLPQPAKPAADPHAGTREDPAPLHVKAVYEGSWWTDYAGFEFEMVSSSRGNAALKKAKSLSPYNITPPRSQEYLLVEFRVRALSAPGGRARIGNADFFFVSASGAEYRQHFLINAPHELRNLYSDGEHTAVLACLIDKGDRPLLVFQPESEKPLWFDPNPVEAK